MKAAKTVLFLLALCLLASAASAEDQSKPWLKGLKAVKVNISISQALVDAGVPGAQLRTQIELKMRNAGLQVDPKLVQPVLCLEITGVRGPGTNNFASYVCLQVSENVKIARNGEDVYTIVWGPDLYVHYSPSDVANDLVTTSMQRVDTFLNDWLRENPK